MRWCLLVLLFLCYAIQSLAAAVGEKTLVIDNFEGPDPLARWSMTSAVRATPTTQGVSRGQGAIEYHIASAEKIDKNDERRLRISFPKPLDLSAYTRLCFDIDGDTAGFVTAACSLYNPDTRSDAGWAAKVKVVPGRGKTVFSIDLVDLVPKYDSPPGNPEFTTVDISAIAALAIGTAVKPHHDVVIRIDNLRAEYDPAIGSPREKLKRQAAELRAQYEELRQSLSGRKLSSDVFRKSDDIARTSLAEVDEILKRCEQAEKEGFIGKLNETAIRLSTLRSTNKIGILRLIGEEAPAVWSISPYINCIPKEYPAADSKPLKQIDTSMARGEYRDAVIMLSAQENDLQLKVELQSTDARLLSSTLVQEALYVNAAIGRPVADAHFPLTDGMLKIPACESRQIRLRFDATQSGLPPGNYRYQLKLTNLANKLTKVIPGELRVWSFELPDMSIMSNNAYGEYTGSTVADMQDLTVRDMKSVGLNVFYVSPPDILVKAADGSRRFEFARLDEHVGMIMKNWGAGAPPQFIFSLGGGVAPSSENMKAWCDEFRRVMAKHGIDSDHWYFVISDEAQEVGLLDVELPLAESLKAAAPWVKITSNSSAMLTDSNEVLRYFRTLDRCEPDLDLVVQMPCLMPYLRMSGKPITFYRCRGDWTSRGANMYGYYRVYAWLSIREGAQGLGVWTYCADRGADPWKGTASIYSLVLRHPTQRALVHTRRLETLREGIDDYRYVAKLRQVAAAKGPDATGAVEKLVGEAVNDVISHPEDTSRCEVWRMRIAEQILSLQ